MKCHPITLTEEILETIVLAKGDSMGREICKFKTGSKKVLPADSARADSLTFATGDLWIFS